MIQKKLYIFIQLWILSTFLIGCNSITSPTSPTPILYENNIDLSPLINLELPDNMGQVTSDILDMEKIKLLPGVIIESQGTMALESLRYSYKNINLKGQESLFTVDIQLTNSPNEAMAVSKDLCIQPIYKINFPIQGTENGYCITHLQQGRSGPDIVWGHVSYDYYMGSVSVQKGNLSINISEYTQTTDRTLMNEAIKQMADNIVIPIFYPNQVDLTPLLILKLPENVGTVAKDIIDLEKLYLLPNIDIPVLEYETKERLNFKYQIITQNKDKSSFQIYFFLEDSIKSAIWRTDKMCARPIYLSNVSSEDSVIYCITYLVKAPPNGTDLIYRSNIVVQHGNLVISIEEQTNTLDHRLISEVIKQVSELIIPNRN